MWQVDSLKAVELILEITQLQYYTWSKVYSQYIALTGTIYIQGIAAFKGSYKGKMVINLYAILKLWHYLLKLISSFVNGRK